LIAGIILDSFVYFCDGLRFDDFRLLAAKVYHKLRQNARPFSAKSKKVTMFVPQGHWDMPGRLRPWGSTSNPARFFEKKRGKKLSNAKLRFAQIFSSFRKRFPKSFISATAGATPHDLDLSGDSSPVEPDSREVSRTNDNYKFLWKTGRTRNGGNGMNLFEEGRTAAAAFRPSGSHRGRREARTWRHALEIVETVRRQTEKRSDRPSPAAQWLLDNAWLARREGIQALSDLRQGKHLRRAGETLYVARLARQASEVCSRCTPDELSTFLSGVQETEPLTEGELSLFIPALKGAFCLQLSLLCRSLVADTEPDELASAFERVFTCLRTLSSANLGPVLEEASAVERILRQDPANLYAKMDESTKGCYRQRVCELARKRRLSERETALRALDLSREATGRERHIGWFLYRRPLGEHLHPRKGAVYIGAVLLPAFFLALWLGFRLNSVLLFFLLLLPASDLCKNVADFLAVRLVPPRPVPRMALSDGVPKEGQTLCVICGLLTGKNSGQEYADALERCRLANRDCGEALRFGLLADLADRATPMGEEEKAWVQQAKHAIEALNQTYGGGFYLFFRPPTFQSHDERYGGWERKRGALLELTRLLRGRPSGLRVTVGDTHALDGTKYVITLDSDTHLNVGSARELVGAMLHPLNHPVLDRRKRIVIEGYGLLQPRIGVDLHAANRSRFARVFAGLGGVDPYGGACSDIYHDLFDRGSYTGKGIFDVDAFSHCLDGRFPENRILSHDLLEGAYLHAGLLGDVELTDGYPSQVASYFSRLHRWVRGDWQLLPWLGRWVRDERGERVRNPISVVDKWKIFDNLRRSLSPVFTLAALLLGTCSHAPAFAAAGALAVLTAWSNLLLSGADLAFRGGVGVRRRYHSTVIAGLGGAILQTLLQLLFLPYQAWICLSAACTALWRSFISQKKMLEWVTAAASERSRDSLSSNFRLQWSALAVGGFCLLFANFPAGGAVGLIWAASPAFAWALSRPIPTDSAAPEADRPFLLHQAGLIWKYFEDWLRPEDHWLPPDNVQERPWLGPARRTSPTNIGMALLSCVTAADLGLTTREKAIEIIAHILDTVERLDKWQGHLYNWYDTAGATPLAPRYVSTVDSGNLRGCLIALREALREWGEPALAARAAALSDAMNLRPLYDAERKLFTIGYDAEKGTFPPGWYDLMASEARLTSYLAIALGEVSPRHWRRLGRMLVGENDYCGMASWTGTMFEYFMPQLLLPSEPGSLLYESMAFCVYAQKRRGDKTGTPWGISESGFYAFDPGMAYQYKAHGAQALGLKRGLDRELVVAPYASFLALAMAPRSAARNLRRLRELGLEGPYGLWEAVDFTTSRVPAGERFAVVRSVMSHHLGMSLVAIGNALSEGGMRKRFLRDRSMAAFQELLQEKAPVDAPVQKPERTLPLERPRPLGQSGLRREGAEYDLTRPACCLLSNGLVTALCTDAGTVRLTDDRGETPILTRFRERYAPAGVSFFLRDGDGTLYPLTAAPFYAEESGSRWAFDGGGASWYVQRETLSASVRLTLPRGARAALWTVELSGPADGELIAYLEPVLAKQADYLAHPAYSKLSLESGTFEHGICFTRRPRQGTRQAALAAAWDAEPSGWDTSREVALGRGGLRRLAQALETPTQETQGAVIDPCLLVRFPKEGDAFTLHFALGFEDGRAAAEEAAQCALRVHDQTLGWPDALLRSLQMTAREGERAMELLSVLAFPPARTEQVPQSALWPFGISGDVPILLVEGEQNPLDLFPLKAHALLTRCGFPFDLVYPISDGGDYRRPKRNAILEEMKTLEMESALGQRGGVHLAECPTEADTVPLLAWAAAELDECGTWKDRRDILPAQPPAFPLHLTGTSPIWEVQPSGEFVLDLHGDLPPLGWSHFLVNPRFGWLTDETGCGHLWRGSAREGQLTPWNNDPLSIGGPERFLLCWNGETHSLFADGDGCPVRVTYGFGWARWEKQWSAGCVTTTVCVPWGGARRLLLLELGGTGELTVSVDGRGEIRCRAAGKLLLSTTAEGTVEESPTHWEAPFQETVKHWRGMVRPLTVDTPDTALNHYLNGWCLYQILACRMLARTSHYQNGGAFGFRDQLQDALSLLLFCPERTKAQILRCCAHQFLEGDVQHWWHEVGEETALGVRTRISDDLLWLPYAVSRYGETWGDWTFLEETVCYLAGEPLKEEEENRYFSAVAAPSSDTVYGHALNAIRCALERGVGEHGLMKMGTGDWNDGMDRVGRAGCGESVWLTWFTAVTLRGFVPVAERMGDAEAAELCRDWADTLTQAASAAWDGAWYLRGWYDDGTSLGSRHSEACQLDSIAQSWAAFLAGSSAKQTETALRSAIQRLFDRKAGIVKLFDPPFDIGEADPGYIKAYLPGVRENGGQYTHAAVWLSLACYEIGWPEDGYAILHTLLPETHPREVYQAEPFVLAGDVYANPQHMGRGGWSWYTGAAGWYCQTALSGLLGLSVREGRLSVSPKLPAGWSDCRLVWRGARWTLRIFISRGNAPESRFDGCATGPIPLRELEGTHTLEIILPE